MEDLQQKMEETKKTLFEMLKSIREMKGAMVLTSSLEGPKLAIEKCVEMLNYLQGNVQEFSIPFEGVDESADDDEDDEDEYGDDD